MRVVLGPVAHQHTLPQPRSCYPVALCVLPQHGRAQIKLPATHIDRHANTTRQLHARSSLVRGPIVFHLAQACGQTGQRHARIHAEPAALRLPSPWLLLVSGNLSSGRRAMCPIMSRCREGAVRSMAPCVQVQGRWRLYERTAAGRHRAPTRQACKF